MELSIPAILSHWLQVALGKSSLSASHNISIRSRTFTSLSLCLPTYTVCQGNLGSSVLLRSRHISMFPLATSIASLPQLLGSLLGYKVLWPKKVLPGQKDLIRPLKLPLSPHFLASSVPSLTIATIIWCLEETEAGKQGLLQKQQGLIGKINIPN